MKNVFLEKLKEKNEDINSKDEMIQLLEERLTKEKSYLKQLQEDKQKVIDNQSKVIQGLQEQLNVISKNGKIIIEHKSPLWGAKPYCETGREE